VSQVAVAILELPARHGAPELALRDADQLLARGPRVDLALLPEASITGYVDAFGDFDLSPFAEPLLGRTFALMSELARLHATPIAAPLIERDGDRVFNAFFVVGPDGALVAHYRKRHPWLPEKWASPGDLEMPRFELAGVSFTIAICYDVHFLEREAMSVLGSVDALLFPSAWVDDDGKIDLRAGILGGIASRTGIIIVNANWGVGVPALRGQGASRAIAPTGEMARLKTVRGRASRLDVVVSSRTQAAAPF
jgi:5-aminopentanamidase